MGEWTEREREREVLGERWWVVMGEDMEKKVRAS